MPTITDWLMVIITFVYVAATILICIFNGRSAKATQEQVAESQRQFDESKRLEFLPFFQIENGNGSCNAEYSLELLLDDSNRSKSNYGYSAKIKNIGRGSAINIEYSWKNLIAEYDRGSFLFSALQNGDAHTIFFDLYLPLDKPDKCEASICFRFMDLLNHCYTQEIIFCFDYSSGSRKLSGVKSESPKLCKELGEY